MLTIETPRRRGAALLALPLLLLALAGCSAAADDAPAGGGAQPSTGVGSPEYLQWELDVTHCLQDEGIAIKDPDPVAGIDDSAMSDPGWQTAFPKCLEKVGQPPLAEVQMSDQELHDQTLKQAACLREQGLDIADPAMGDALQIPRGQELTDAMSATCLSGE